MNVEDVPYNKSSSISLLKIAVVVSSVIHLILQKILKYVQMNAAVDDVFH